MMQQRKAIQETGQIRKKAECRIVLKGLALVLLGTIQKMMHCGCEHGDCQSVFPE
jgi:hypothetical protein